MWKAAFGSRTASARARASAKRSGLQIGAVARRVHVGEVEDRSHPGNTVRDCEDVVERAEIADTAHHLDTERDGTAFLLQPPPQHPQLLDDAVESVLASPAEQESRMEDDRRRAAGGGDPGAPVERADGGAPLPARRLEVAHEAEQRCVDGERDVALSRQLAEPAGEVVVHPEARLEVDLARVVPALAQEVESLLRALPRRKARRPEANASHTLTLSKWS